MDVVWQWFSQNFESILGVSWNFLLFALTVAGVIFGWKSIRLTIPSKVRKAKKEIVGYLQTYLVNSSMCEMRDVRSIINSVCMEHQLNPGSVTEEEIMDDLKTSIHTSNFLDDSSRKSINRKLDELMLVSDWNLVEMKISDVISKNLDDEELEHGDLQQSILKIFKEHINYIEKRQSIKISLTVKEFHYFKSLLLSLAILILLMVLALLLKNDNDSVKTVYVMLIVLGLSFIPVFSMINYLVLNRIFSLGSIVRNQSHVDVPIPFIMRVTKRFVPPYL